MSDQDTMKLVAELLDKTSGPLKDIQKSLKETSDIAKRLHADGKASVDQHHKAYHEFGKKIKEARTEVAGAFAPTMAALGITMVGAAEGVGKMVEGLRALGEQYKVMRDLTRRTGATPDFLEATANVIHELTGQDASAAIQSLGAMKEHMDRLTRLRPDEINKWNDAYTGLYESLGKRLVGKTLPQQIEETMAWFERHPEVAADKKRDILNLMGLDPQLATVKLHEFRDVVEEEFAYQKAHPFNSGLAHDLDKSFAGMDRAVRGLKYNLQEAFGPDVVKGVKAISEFLNDKENVEAIKTSLGAVVEAIGKTINSTMHDIQNIKALYNWFLGVNHNGMKGFKGYGDMDPMGSDYRNGQRPSWTHSGEYDRAFPGDLKNITPWGGADAEKNVKKPVKEGTKEGLEEFYNSLKSQRDTGGFTPMSFHDGVGGGGGKFGSKEFPAIDDPGNGTTPRSLDWGEGNSTLQEQRAKFAEELKANPQTRKELAGMLSLEGARDPVPVVESLMNRMAYTKGSLHRGLHSRFYGPINRGQLPGAMARLERDRKLSGRMNAAIDAALAGSNLIKGATDQGMVSDPNGRWPGGRVMRDQVFNDWGGGPGGHEGARRFREAQQRGLLDAARKAGVAGGGGPQKVEGDASLKIDLNGFPKGTKTDLTYGGLFTQYTLSRGQQMEASELK